MGLDMDIFEQEKRYIKFPFDALAYVLDQQASGQPNHEIAAKLMYEKNYINSSVSQEAKERSEQIRRYYRNKFTLHTLKGNSLSKFRKTVQEIVDTPDVIEIDSFAPLVTLSNFYAEDVVVDDLIKSDLKTDPSAYRSRIVCDEILELEYITKNKRLTRNNSRHNYFFKNNSDELFCMQLSLTNSCINLFERELEQKFVKVRATGSGYATRGTNFGYVLLNQWELCI